MKHMRLMVDVQGPDADRLYEFAEETGVRLDEAAAVLVHLALEPTAPTEPVPPAASKPSPRVRPPRPRNVPIVERVGDLLPPDWQPPETSAWKREIEDFKFDVRRLHALGATDADMSVELNQTRQRVATTRRRLGLPINRGQR